MTHTVWLTDDATQDLREIYDYIADHDAPEKAGYVLDRIEDVINSLEDLPDRCSYPRELSAVGVREYRELYFKPYRIIYRVIDKDVYIYCITDGRRDFQILLERRLLGH